MQHLVRILAAIIAVLALSGSAIPQQALDPLLVKRVRTIALLEIPGPGIYDSAESSPGDLAFSFGHYGKDAGDFGEFSFGRLLQANLKRFLEENRYRVLEHPAERQNRYGLVEDYGKLDIPNVDAYLDVAAVEAGYKWALANTFGDGEVGPIVAAVVRLVSAETNEVLFATSIQYGWKTSSFAPGMQLDSPDNHVYPSQADMQLDKDRALQRLERGVEVVAFNIARSITPGEFVSWLSPTMEEVDSDRDDTASIEFMGAATNEIVTRTYEPVLWRQSGELAEGDAANQSYIYIRLRARQLAEEDRRQKIIQTAKLATENTYQSMPRYDVSGIYTSRITGLDSTYMRQQDKTTLKIEQRGNRVSGTFGADGKFEGKIEDNEITVEWHGGGIHGNGQWRVNQDSKGLTGKWWHPARNGKWNLVRKDATPVARLDASDLFPTEQRLPSVKYDLGGTYTSDITSDNPWRLEKPSERRMKITITQDGNRIIAVNEVHDLTLDGEIEGDEVTFVSRPGGVSSDAIKGKWLIDAANNQLVGTWRHPHGGGTWNLNRTDDSAIAMLDSLGTDSDDGDQQPAYVDISGTYVSNRFESNWVLKQVGRMRMRLEQDLLDVDGSFYQELNGPISGKIKGNTIEVTWEAGYCASGVGDLEIGPYGRTLRGALICRSQGNARYDLFFTRQ